jgi:hypothetical protein
MSIHETRAGRFEVRWRSEDRNRSKTFQTIEEAEAFNKTHSEPPVVDESYDPKAYALRMTDQGRKPWIGGSRLEISERTKRDSYRPPA